MSMKYEIARKQRKEQNTDPSLEKNRVLLVKTTKRHHHQVKSTHIKTSEPNNREWHCLATLTFLFKTPAKQISITVR